MQTFFTSDTHFFHSRILELCPTTRQGSNVEEMNELIVQQWNAVVAPSDTVYHLGDVSFGKGDSTKQLLCRLNGKINIIPGNHDTGLFKAADSLPRNIVLHPSAIAELRIGTDLIVMCHYPLEQWNRGHYGSYHLHGHTHGSVHSPYRRLDVGIDGELTTNMSPLAWEDIQAHLISRPVHNH